MAELLADTWRSWMGAGTVRRVSRRMLCNATRVSLRRLQAAYSIAVVCLVLITGALGIAGVKLWDDAASESERLAAMTQVVQAIRGTQYRQIKEVSDHVLLGDELARQEFAGYGAEIEASFLRVSLLVRSPGEARFVDALRTAHADIRAFGESYFGTAPGVRIANAWRLDRDLENVFNRYEGAFNQTQQFLDRQREALAGRMAYVKTIVPVIFAIPVALAALMVLASRPFLRRGIVDPLYAVTEAAQRISRGDLAHRVPERGFDEMAALARGVNRMAADLALHRESLLRSEKQAMLGALVPIVAHNIRNPLASIRATAQVLADEPISAEVREGLEGILRASDRLQAWTHSLLSYLNPLQPRCTVVDLVPFADVVAGLVEARAAAAGVAIVVQSESLSIEACFDRNLIEQALTGLLNNAIEASPAGSSVSVQIATLPGWVLVSIRDAGAGLARQPVPRGLSPIASTKPYGSGLGIPFALKVCEVLGGRLEFINHDDGTEVTVALPRESQNT